MFCYENDNLEELDNYEYKNEYELQKILFNYPEIILSIPELEINSLNYFLVARELSISCGSIDLLIITEHADIIIVETKLFRNPESSRKVVAQIIDYIKTIAQFDIDVFINMIDRIKDKHIDENKKKDDRFISLLKKNIEKGNITGLILGDEINPNLLEMVSSIHSAPHLSFSLLLVALESKVKGKCIILNPIVISKTNEIERSVINISVDLIDKKILFSTQVPEKEGKGSKPIISWDEFLNNFNDKERISIFDKFHNNWLDIDADGFNMGTVGFSAGVIINNIRYPIQYAYSINMELWTEKKCRKLNLNDSLYELYKNSLMCIPNVYDKYIIANKTFIEYVQLTNNELNALFEASLLVAKKLKNEEI